MSCFDVDIRNCGLSLEAYTAMNTCVRALILDFGEVLTRSQPVHVLEQMAASAGLPAERFLVGYWQHRMAYDAGLPAAEYWSRVAGGGDLSPDRIAELIGLDVLSWSDYRHAVWDVAAEFRARGNRTAVLSNGVPEIIARVRKERRLETWFDIVIVSCEVGLCKPQPGIYRLCLERLEVPAASALFVDDRRENLEGAEAVGLRTLHFTGDESVPALRRVLGL